MAAAGCLTLLTPLSATLGGIRLLMAARLLVGLCHGVVFPAVYGAWAHWAPPQVRGRH